MQKIKLQLPEIKLVGIKARTNNAAEMNSNTAIIGEMVNKYDNTQIADKINNRKQPGVTYCIYTEYDSDFNGDYTYFIGEEVDNFNQIPQGLSQLIIPFQSYIKFTTDSGSMPLVCINAWKEIWQMDSSTLTGERAFIADFEIYDQRAKDPLNTILDIYIGVK
jgi:predicted transcriptional regulator YdeE